MSSSTQLRKQLSEYAYGQKSLGDFYAWYSSAFADLAADPSEQSLVAALESELVDFSGTSRSFESETSFRENLKKLLSARPPVQQVTASYNVFTPTPPTTGNLEDNSAQGLPTLVGSIS